MPLAPRKSIALCPEEPQVTSESQRFESSFAGLSRVNDSLMQINLVQRRIGTPKHRQNTRKASPKRERAARRMLLRVRRLGVADDALDGRERAAQRAFDLIDILV